MDSAPTLRVMLYSHDSWGLGHLRRSLAIAHAINEMLPGSSLLIATGSPNATSFPLACGIDVLKLPSVTKNASGDYQARQLNDRFDSICQLRSSLLQAAFQAFNPDLLIVDHQLVGLAQEALPLLEAAKKQNVYCVYGMRDVLDSLEATEAGWNSPACQWAMEHGYDEIWIYGDEQYFRTADFYPTLSASKHQPLYTGLVTNSNFPLTQRSSSNSQVLATIGGGEDGGQLLITFLQSMLNKPRLWDATIVTGPLLSGREKRQLAQLGSRLSGVNIHEFHNNIPGLMHASDLVLSMAGYNTCAELVNSRRRAVLVPRVTPRREQLIRARYLEKHGVARCLIKPSPDQLFHEIEQQLAKPTTNLNFPNTNGLEIVAQRCWDIAAAQLGKLQKPLELKQK